jgi:nitrilase
MPSKIAVVQKPPVMLDRDATIGLIVELIEEVSREGASLVVFPEAYLPGYPTWVWRLRPGGDMGLSSEIHAQLRANAIDLETDQLDPVRRAAERCRLTVALGIHELDSRFSGTTLFNTVVVVGPDGRLLNRHRKLMPTNPERMVWGMGDASGLRVVETPVGRIGCLICWECYMPLARYALYAQGLEILINPTWDNGETSLATFRHIAKEAGAWVIATATALQGSDMPAEFPECARLFPPEEWINDGDAVVVKPGGTVLAGPLNRVKGVLYAEIDAEAARRARRSLDVAGHYSRHDIFSLSVDRRSTEPVRFSDD